MPHARRKESTARCSHARGGLCWLAERWGGHWANVADVSPVFCQRSSAGLVGCSATQSVQPGGWYNQEHTDVPSAFLTFSQPRSPCGLMEWHVKELNELSLKLKQNSCLFRIGSCFFLILYECIMCNIIHYTTLYRALGYMDGIMHKWANPH